jgi:hypothetical protein
VARTDRRWCVALLLVCCVVLATAGCAAARPPARAAPVAAGPSRPVTAARYLAIAEDGNDRLEIDFDRLAGRDRDRLGAARADLRDAAATERRFDRRLLAIMFPAVTERIARLLFQVNQSRASLTISAATSVSLRQLGSVERRLSAANVPVEEAVRVIRSQLGLPPPDTS